jgi:hypothetical protein
VPNPPGRPPAPPLDLDAAKIAELVAQSHEFAKDKGKLKSWLAPKRIFHVLFQDHLSTLHIPGGKGVALNAQSSKLFLEMSEPLAAALEGVEEEEDPGDGRVHHDISELGHDVVLWNDGKVTTTKQETNARKSQGGVVLAPQRKRRVKRRKPARKNSR